MVNNFSTSINILRDTNRDFNYIPTKNTIRVVSQIVNDFKKGIHSFNLVGSYGTGKSSFLVAFEQSLNGTKRYFNPNFPNNTTFDFVKIVGSYTSIIKEFENTFSVGVNENKHENIFAEIFNKYYSQNDVSNILFILIDEFGKFLEFACKNNPENELYFIQQLAEFCNNPKYGVILITTVHQSLESYAYSLNNSQQQEWIKVKGRFREITFNEPVEQLLYLASEHISKNNKYKTQNSLIEKCLKIAIDTKAFDFNKDFLNNIVAKLYPLDLLSANVLTISLQRYGQNERSLFSFLESTDHTGLDKFNQKDNPFFNLSNVYDFLNFNFYSFLTSRYNPDFPSWSSIRAAIEEVERAFEEKVDDYLKAVKSIGLLNFLSASGAILDFDFLSKYLKISCGVLDAENIIKDLELKKIIHYRSHSKQYILFEGTDLDIQNALIVAGNNITKSKDVTALLLKHITFNPVFAKQYSFATGTPRYFEFVISENPIDEIPSGQLDGFINLFFNTNIDEEDIARISGLQEEAIIYCFFKNSGEIENLLFEIEKIQKVIEENKEDKVAKRELENIRDSQLRLLNHYITDSIYSNSEEIKWFFKGDEKIVANKKDFNKLISQVCSKVYDMTPIFKNELINRHKISSSIGTAKNKYFKALVNSYHEENLGFEDSKFPPEKTIYLSLLKENGILTTQQSSKNILPVSKNSTFTELWIASEEFLNSAKSEQLKISDFTELLSKKPFKLKQGLIDIWIPTFLFLKRNDFAIFNDGRYIPNLSEENLALIAKYPEKYFIKTFNVEGVKLDIFNSYRSFLDQSIENKFGNDSFIETIKPFIIFYNQLPDYAKHTKRLSPSAKKIRMAISESRDPEDTFFEDFPNALGISLINLKEDKALLERYAKNLQDAIKELRTSYDELLKRFESFICKEFVGTSVHFEEYKAHFQKRFKKLRKHLLLSNQKTFVQRLDSSLDDKNAWLNSIAQAIIGKTMDKFYDEDEIILYDNFKSMILELDGLTKISKMDIDEGQEDVIAVKIDSFFGQIDPAVVRIPKNKSVEIDLLKSALKNNLGNDRTSNIAAVLNLLKELLK